MSQTTEVERLKRELRFTKIELDVQKNHLERISNLYSILTSTLDLEKILDLLLENLAELVNYDLASIYMYKNDKNRLMFTKKNDEIYLHSGENLDEIIAKERENVNTDAILRDLEKKQDLILIPELDYRIHTRYLKGDSNIKSIMAVPIKNMGKIVAKIILFSSLPEAFIKEVALITQIFANQAGVAIENANFFQMLEEKNRKIEELNAQLSDKNNELEILVEKRTEKLNSMTLSLVTSLENANLYNDENTGKHIVRVAAFSEIIARKMQLPSEKVKEIHLYSTLHDIGKVGIPDSILKKPGRYNGDEFKLMQEHVNIGYKMIVDAPIPDTAKNIVKYHHEKFDGSGYSDKLVGKAIPIEARIVTIADVFDALISKRSYKDAFEVEKALNIMRESRGKHFDPEILDVFFSCLDEIINLKQKHED